MPRSENLAPRELPPKNKKSWKLELPKTRLKTYVPGPSGQKKEKSGERESKKDNEKTAKSSEKPERKRQNSPRRERIKFFKEKGTTNAKLAEQVDVDCQLLVYGLPESRFQWRDRERALNKLVTNLSSEEIGDQGITLEQKHIIGAYHTSNKDKPG